MAIAFGLRGLNVEQEAKAILGELSHIQDRFGKFFTDYSLVGKHLTTVINKYADTEKSAGKLNEQIGKVTGQKTELIEG
jgi:DNA anti-recombination protein RmuC